VLGTLWQERVERDTKLSEAEVTHAFNMRRLAAVKERILSAGTANKSAPAAAGFASDPLFERPFALSNLNRVGKAAGLYMFVGPKGEGKTTLVKQFVASHPYAICVDMQRDDMDAAVRAVAEAIGYDLGLTAEETKAQAAGSKLPDVAKPQGRIEYNTLLTVFRKACEALRSEGKLAEGCCPVLILDHSNRPLSGPLGRSGATGPPELLDVLPASSSREEDRDFNLIYSTVELGHEFANSRIASIMLVSSDPLKENGAWTSAGGRDSIKYIRALPFTVEDARELLSRCIFACLLSSDRAGITAGGVPCARVLGADGQAVEVTCAGDLRPHFASSIDFLVQAVGTRARWLSQMVQSSTFVPHSDYELGLGGTGIAVPLMYRGFLPPELRERIVDSEVWADVQDLIELRKAAARELMRVRDGFTLPPALGAAPTADLQASRVLSVDAALRELVAAPTPVSYDDLLDRHFVGREPVLRRLSENHVIFYNHKGKAVETCSDLDRRVVKEKLDDEQHNISMALVRKLQAWQAAWAAEAKEEQQSVWWQRTVASFGIGELAAIRRTVKQLEGEIATLRDKLRVNPRGANANAGSASKP